MTDWFEEWFGEEYLRLYPHRDEEDARRAVALIASVVPLEQRLVLDLACGPGRHSAPLREERARVVGLDLSAHLLAQARARLGPGARLVRGDMRYLPFRSATFDVIVNLFTSFGYFAEASDDRAVLGEAARILVPGGILILDYFNAEVVRAGLVASEERRMGEQLVRINRRISDDGRFVIKEMTPSSGRTFVERVRLHAPADLEQLLTGANLEIRSRFGAYDGRPLGAEAPRAIFVAERPR